MWATMVVGNVLFGLAILGFYKLDGGNRPEFLHGLLFATVAFLGGIAVGIVANQPKRVKRSARHRPAVNPADYGAFEITE